MRSDMLADTFRKWSLDDASRLAAALSFYTAFSMAPLLLIMTALLGLLFGEQASQGLLQERLSGFIGPQRAAAMQDLIATAERPRAVGAAGVIGLATLLWGASAVVGELQSSLNKILEVSAPQEGLWLTLRRRLVSIGFVLGMGFLMLASLGLSAAAAAAGGYFGSLLGLEEGLLQAFNQGASFLVVTALFTAMFRFLPDAHLAWRDLLAGGTLTAVLFTFGNYALGVYLARQGAHSAYGAAGSLMAFLLWTYYCAQILYFGAEFLNALVHGRDVSEQSRKTV